MEVTEICLPVVTGCWSTSAIRVISATSFAADEETVRRRARVAREANDCPCRGLRPAVTRLLSTTGRESGVWWGRVVGV